VSPAPVVRRVSPSPTTGVRSTAALAAALLAVAFGAWSAIQLPRQREPRWAATLAPLAGAPLPPGTVVALAVPSGVVPERRGPLLFEAVWQRPDLHWVYLDDPRQARAACVLVALPGAGPPAGWHELWHQRGLSIFTRECR
jgi:hypothetical protein